MNWIELNRVLTEIEKGEDIGVGAICAQAGIDRSYLSRKVNSELDEEKPVGKNVLFRLQTAFPKYFGLPNDFPYKGASLKDDEALYKVDGKFQAKEIVELRATVAVLTSYVLKIQAKVSDEPVQKVIDEFEQDFALQLQKLKKP